MEKKRDPVSGIWDRDKHPGSAKDGILSGVAYRDPYLSFYFVADPVTVFKLGQVNNWQIQSGSRVLMKKNWKKFTDENKNLI
jgi:hypothetical protein